MELLITINAMSPPHDDANESTIVIDLCRPNHTKPKRNKSHALRHHFARDRRMPSQKHFMRRVSSERTRNTTKSQGDDLHLKIHVL